MGRIALIVLILVTGYFTFLKPYLILKRVLFGLEGLKISLSPLTVKADTAYLYSPVSGGYSFVGLGGFWLSYDGTLRIRAEEVILITLREKGTPEGRRRPPTFPIPGFLRRADISLDNLYITSVGGGHLWVHVKDLRLKEGFLKLRSVLHVNGRPVVVDVKEVRLLSKGAVIRSASILSDDFSFSIKGFLSERGRGTFTVDGRVKPVEWRNYLVDRVRVSGTGELTYTHLKADLEIFTKKVVIKGRRDFRNVRGRAYLEVRFGKDVIASGSIWGEDFSASYKLTLMPDRVLDLKVHRLTVDERLLGFREPLRAEVWGDVVLNRDKGRVLASLHSGRILFRDTAFQRGFLFLDYSYRDRSGFLSLSVEGPGRVDVEGDIKGRSFSGRVSLSEFPLSKGDVSLLLSYRGGVAYREGSLELVGSGSFSNLLWRGISLGGGTYRVVFTGGRVFMTFHGEGFRGSLKGRPVESVRAEVRLEGFDVVVGGARLFVSRGRVEVVRERSFTSAGISIHSGRIFKDPVEVAVSGTLLLTLRGRERGGEFSFSIADLKVRGRSLGGGSVRGKLEGDSLTGTLTIERVGEGTFRANIGERSVFAEGSLRYGGFEGRVQVRAGPGRAEFWTEGVYRIAGRDVPVRLEGIYVEDNLTLYIKPVRRREGVVELAFGGLEVKGEKLLFNGAKVRLLGEELVTVSRSEGYVNLSEGSAGINLPYRGGLEGEVNLKLKGGELLFSSRGKADLRKISFLAASLLGGRAEGGLTYRVDLRRSRIYAHAETEPGSVLYSRFLSVPMNLNLELEAEGRSMAAFLSLWSEGRGLTANLGTGDLRNYYLYLIAKELPVTYRTDAMKMDLRVSGNGWLEVKDLKEGNLRMDLKFNGEIRVTKTGRRKARRKLPPVRIHVNFRSDRPVKVRLPEGYVYAHIKGEATGTLADPTYRLEVLMVSGELTYFGRTFYIRSGKLTVLRTPEGDRRIIEVDLVNPGDDLNIHISLRGDPSDPDIIVWSEPPKDVGEIITRLIGGGSGEGAIPVSQAILRSVGYGKLGEDLISALGIDVNILTKTGSQGELGFSLNIRKKISSFFSVEYQQSTLRDPRETFYGGGIRLPGRFSIFGRVFSDDTSEIKLRFIRKFDF